MPAGRIVGLDGARARLAGLAGARTRYLLATVGLMVLFYAALYHPYSVESLPGRALVWYLRQTAELSGWVLRMLGERTQVEGTQVLGRFSYIVVLDCAALDAQALFAAAVLAFPARRWAKAIGLCVGLLAIFGLNFARLVILYYAGLRSQDLFQWLHEEVLVFAIIAFVSLAFLAWAQWARATACA